MTYNIYPMPPQSSDFSFDVVPNNGYLQQSPYAQPNHVTHHMPNNSNSNMQKPNDDPCYKEICEKHKRDSAIIFKETFGVELRDKIIVCQKSYPKSFDAIPYPHNFKVPEFIKFAGRIVELHGSMLDNLMHKWVFM